MVPVPLIVVGSVVGLAFLGNPSTTATALTGTLTIAGSTFICVKVTEAVKRDMSQIIKYTGYCLAGITAIVLLKNAVLAIQPTVDFFKGIGSWLENATAFLGHNDNKPPWCGGPQLN